MRWYRKMRRNHVRKRMHRGNERIEEREGWEKKKEEKKKKRGRLGDK